MQYSRGTDVSRSLFWTAALRAVLCLFVATIIRLNLEPDRSLQSLLPYLLIAAAFASNLVYLALSSLWVPSRPLLGAGVWLDVLFTSALVYLTGGVGSDFLLLYFGPVLAAAVFFTRGISLLVASFATTGLFFSAAVYAVVPGNPPHVAEVWIAKGLPDAHSLIGVLTLQALAFHLVAFLASSLTSRLRSASIQTGQILENMSDGVITVSKTGHIVYLNSRALDLLELDSSPDLVGAPLDSVFPSDVVDAFRSVISQCAPRTVEIEIPPRPTPAQIIILPLADHAGRLRGANVILHDLTERRRLTEALRRAERLEATATTVASIAHEIRNPLAAIRGSAQELANVLDIPENDRLLLDLVTAESDRLNRILTDFLNFSRMPRPQLAACDLRPLLDDVAAELIASSTGRKADITVSGPPSLIVTADAERLRQVLLNLGLNALDATAGRGPILYRLGQNTEYAVIETLDRGPGVDPSISEKIFEPFFTTKTAGTGLGLSIARRIVEDHSGRLELADPDDGWTRVKVLLPFAEQDPVASFPGTGPRENDR